MLKSISVLCRTAILSVTKVFILLALCFQFLTGATDLAPKIERLLNTDNTKEQAKLITDILKKKPSWDSLVSLLKDLKYETSETTGVIRLENLCLDGVKRPFCLYLPAKYDPNQKTPLITILHGGVNRPEIVEKPEEYVKEFPFTKYADEFGYILLFPFGQAGATWWDSVGVTNILDQIRITKRRFNIDDNRVYLTGFSDGASASFFFAMTDPNDFAAFMPFNGHPGIGSIDFGIQNYFVNLFNRPLYVVNTDLDQLYPDKAIRPMMELAQKAGANILYRIYTGIGHDFDYAPKELPLTIKFIQTHQRNLHPSFIKWETAYPKLGRCMWLILDSIVAKGNADWYQDHNMELVDDRVMFGFVPDDKYQGPGVRIGKVVGDSSLCTILGIKEGDILIKLGKNLVDSLSDVMAYKSNKKCGDSVEMTILSDSKEIEFRSKFPGPFRFNLFKRDLPSARAEASFCANRFDIKTSQLGSFSILIHPGMVQLDQNVVIYADGKKVFDQKVLPSPEFILGNFLKNRDRELIYVNKITINLTRI
ncbi:MAG: hypothetical protein OEZ20_05955 [candidate division WOR-3 bacterium]|nr:hypothetical protein [candidate division WOR-3 bacterium]